MKKKLIYFLIILSITGFFLFSAKKYRKLISRHKRWLERDVAYIITDTERKVFKKLETDLQRDMFIKAFWKNRDPNHVTLVNEYKQEHYKRLRYATSTYGRGTPTPGWKTEMGRIYITLGKPRSVLRFEHETELRPIVIWYYQGLAKYGLPNAFNVVFFKPNNSGDYILYSPVQYGPAALLMHYKGDAGNIKQSYNKLVEIEPDVAKVSLSLIEGDPAAFSSPTMASDILIQKKVVEAPTKRINTAYASKLLKYREQIDIEYSTNYVANSSKIAVIRDNNGIFFVHYLIEPKKLSLEKDDEKLYTTLEITGSVIDEKKRVIYNFSKKVPVKISAKKLPSIANKLFNFEDIFPVIEGTYDINILVRNVVSKEFTSIEKKVRVPGSKSPILSKPLLAYEISNKNNNVFKPFLIGNKQLKLSPKDDFTNIDTLNVFFQILNLNKNEHKGSRVKISLKKDSVIIKELSVEISDFRKVRNIFRSFNLKELRPSYYEIDVKLILNGNVISEESVPFELSLSKKLKRSWNISLVNSKNDPYIYNTIGNQYVNAGDYVRGYNILRSSYYRNPKNSLIAYDYCKILLLLGQHKKNLSIGTKFINSKLRYNFYRVLAHSLMALQDYGKAIDYFKKILNYTGTNIDVLNSIGDSFVKLGKKNEALAAWEKSLELMPDQKEIVTKIANLKKEKK